MKKMAFCLLGTLLSGMTIAENVTLTCPALQDIKFIQNPAAKGTGWVQYIDQENHIFWSSTLLIKNPGTVSLMEPPEITDIVKAVSCDYVFDEEQHVMLSPYNIYDLLLPRGKQKEFNKGFVKVAGDWEHNLNYTECVSDTCTFKKGD